MDQGYLQLHAGEDIPLAYVELEGDIFLMATSRNARWPSWILRNGRCDVSIAGNRSAYMCRLVKDANQRKLILDQFRKKYGSTRVNSWFASDSRCIKLTPLNHEEVAAYENNYFRWLEDEFDSIAEDYDNHIFGNSINAYLRERSVSLMVEAFRDHRTLLEIGCGSGTETIELLRQGHQIVAIDISQQMLDVVKSKAIREGLQGQIELVKLRAGDVNSLISMYGESHFDGIYSTYGAFNCEPDISSLASPLRRLIRTEGKMLLGIYNKTCALESIGYLIKGKPRKAFSRIHSKIMEGDSRFCVDTFPYTPWYVNKVFSPFFRVVRVIGLPVILPPSNLAKYVQPFGSSMKTLKKIDTTIGRHWPFNLLGDHFLTLLEPMKEKS
ncbi:MAG: class I SAM-dependent methyltransferase [Thermoplasmataceae archaeon]